MRLAWAMVPAASHRPTSRPAQSVRPFARYVSDRLSIWGHLCLSAARGRQTGAMQAVRQWRLPAVEFFTSSIESNRTAIHRI